MAQNASLAFRILSFREKEYHPCTTCKGMGWLKQTCGRCGGRSAVHGTTCSDCWGHGWVRRDCPKCGGRGVIPRW
jgi:DnaJ-class molecular chaperone